MGCCVQTESDKEYIHTYCHAVSDYWIRKQPEILLEISKKYQSAVKQGRPSMTFNGLEVQVDAEAILPPMKPLAEMILYRSIKNDMFGLDGMKKSYPKLLQDGE